MPEKKDLDLSSKIKGWGADADWSKRLGVPRERLGEKTGAHWTEPEQQVPKVRINWSTERPGVTPVFGTTCPPKLLSGLLRNYSYRQYSEGRMTHWLILLAADRIDMVEEMFLDIFRGKLPNLFFEMGLDEEFTDENTRLKKLFKKRRLLTAIGALAAVSAVGALAGRSQNRRYIKQAGTKMGAFAKRARVRGQEVLSAAR